MSDVWLASHILLWVLSIVEALLILVLMRQVGSLLLRVGSTPLLDAGVGPAVGEKAPWRPDLSDAEVDEPRTLLAFVSTTCSGCDHVVPALNAIDKDYRPEVQVVAVGRESEAVLLQWRTKLGLRSPIVSNPDAFERFGVDGTPYAFALDDEGMVRGRGGVNHIEHLESLVRTCLHDAADRNPSQVVVPDDDGDRRS